MELIDWLKGKRVKKVFTAKEASNILEFGKSDMTIEVATKKEVEDLEKQIKRTTELDGRRLISMVITDYRREVSEAVKTHFEEVGFNCVIYKEDWMKEYHVFVIGW